MEETQTHSDIRSSSVPYMRAASESQKYWGYRLVKPGQVGLAHYMPDRHYRQIGDSFPADLSTGKVEVWDKRRLYKEAQAWPRPPTYKTSRIRDDGVLWMKRYEKRWRATQLARDPKGIVAYDDFCFDDYEADRYFDSDEYSYDWADPYGGEEAWRREGEIAEECMRREKEAYESVLDGAVERFSRKFRRRLEEDGWSYVDQSSPRTQSVDLEWEGASDGWETLSLTD